MAAVLRTIEEEFTSTKSAGQAHADFANAAREFEESLRRAYFAGVKLVEMDQQWKEIPGNIDNRVRAIQGLVTSLKKYLKPAERLVAAVKDWKK